jgi:hypothetical protein
MARECRLGVAVTLVLLVCTTQCGKCSAVHFTHSLPGKTNHESILFLTSCLLREYMEQKREH